MASSISQRERFTILLASMKGHSMKPNSLCAVPAAQATGVEGRNEAVAHVGSPSGWAQVNRSLPRA